MKGMIWLSGGHGFAAEREVVVRKGRRIKQFKKTTTTMMARGKNGPNERRQDEMDEWIQSRIVGRR
jgi:hypothetical protein